MNDIRASASPAVRTGRIHVRARDLFIGVAIVAIWAGATLSSIFAPDMITGSQHDHLQIAVWVNLAQAILATAFVLFGASLSRRTSADDRAFWTVSAGLVGVVWAASTLLSVFAAPMVTGADPTTIPLAALLAPLFATIATAFTAVYVAGSGGAPTEQ